MRVSGKATTSVRWKNGVRRACFRERTWEGESGTEGCEAEGGGC